MDKWHFTLQLCLFNINILSLIAKHVVVDLKREIIKDGFHRDIITKITLQPEDLHISPNSGMQCSVLLIETLPTGLYVDVFQLETLRAFGGPQVLTDRPVDIEAPEYLSSEHTLYVYSILPSDIKVFNAAFTLSVTLPVHVRYHKPSDDALKTHATVVMFHPRVLMNCTKQDIRTVKVPCDAQNKSLCTWTEVTYKSDTDFLELKVPVAREQDARIVVFCTLVITVLGCSFILYILAFYDHWKVKVKSI